MNPFSPDENDDKNFPSESNSEELTQQGQNNKLSQQSSPLDLLNSFLEQVSGQVAAQTKPGITEIEEIHSIDKSQYAELEMTTALEKKINELQIIANSIEKRNVNPESFSNLDLSKFKVNYPFELNPSQQAAVFTTEKPVLVIAGAGSGKTRVIVYRVSYLIEKGVDAQSILLLTFTRKASKEMLDRVETLLQDKQIGNVTGGTFHSFAAFILRKYANMLNLPANFTIIDTSDSEDIIDLIRTELKFNTKDKKFPRKSRIHDIISYSRNKNTTISDIIHEQYTGLIDFIADIELIHSGYSKYKALSRIFDYDDLIEVLRKSLRDNIRFRESLQNHYQYVLVDEFQDTNVVQKDIVDFIAQKHRRIMVVGDDSQSIYAFRGANYENILRFPETYPECAVVKIEENYRSNQKILDFTNSIIDSAKIGYKKKLFTKNLRQSVPIIKRVYGQEEEAVFIVDRIMELSEQNIPLNEIAILNRADWHNRYIQFEMSKRGIPYVVVGGFRFNERMHVKDIISYLRITYNPADAVAWHRVLKYIGGVGQVTAFSLINDFRRSPDPFSFDSFKQKKFYSELLVLGKMLSKASQPEYTLSQKIEIIIEYYSPILKERADDYFNRMQDIAVLTDLSKKYTELDKFLSDFALDPPSKRVADQSKPLIDEGEEKGKVTITTVHSAKGLEWYAVFIPHALDGMFPSNRAVNIEEMEEERRLFYVACSRAKEELYITFPRNIYSYDAFFHLPSRFLVEMGRELYLFNGESNIQTP
jgi:DNA helicase-2/ATP-dependent DNA helicase PcrA